VRADSVPAFAGAFAAGAPEQVRSAVPAGGPFVAAPTSQAYAATSTSQVPRKQPVFGVGRILSGIFILGVVALILIPFAVGGVGSESGSSSSGGPLAWWAVQLKGAIASVGGSGGGTSGGEVSSLIGTWTSTTPGEGMVNEAVTTLDAPEQGKPFRIAMDIELIVEGVEAGKAIGTWRGSNTRATVDGQSVEVPVEPPAAHVSIGSDGAVIDISTGKAFVRLDRGFTGDRLQTTWTYAEAIPGIASMTGTLDLTRRK
jgi:hypothetical protein